MARDCRTHPVLGKLASSPRAPLDDRSPHVRSMRHRSASHHAAKKNADPLVEDPQETPPDRWSTKLRFSRVRSATRHRAPGSLAILRGSASETVFDRRRRATQANHERRSRAERGAPDDGFEEPAIEARLPRDRCTAIRRRTVSEHSDRPRTRARLSLVLGRQRSCGIRPLVERDHARHADARRLSVTIERDRASSADHRHRSSRQRSIVPASGSPAVAATVSAVAVRMTIAIRA